MQPGHGPGDSIPMGGGDQRGPGSGEPGYHHPQRRHLVRPQPAPPPPQLSERLHRHPPPLCPGLGGRGSAGDHHDQRRLRSPGRQHQHRLLAGRLGRSPDGSTGWSQVGTSTTTAFTDTGLSPSTTYFYRVVASNSAGDSAPSNVSSATTPRALAYAQAPQGNWVGTYGADGYALLGWTGTTDLVSMPKCSLVMDQATRFQWVAGTSGVQVLESPDTTSRNAATWYDPNQLRLHLSCPSAYTGTLHLYALDWEGAGRRETITVNDGSGPQAANISTDFSQGAWVNLPINVAAGGTVTITVIRVAGPNAVLGGIFLGGGPPPPAPPTGLSASALDATDVSLSWTGSSGATAYKIQRSPDGSTGWTQVGTSSTTAFTDSGLSASTTYFYRVLASNGTNDSAPSSVASATTTRALAYAQAPQGNWVGAYGG